MARLREFVSDWYSACLYGIGSKDAILADLRSTLSDDSDLTAYAQSRLAIHDALAKEIGEGNMQSRASSQQLERELLKQALA